MAKRHYRKRATETNPLMIVIAVVFLAVIIGPVLINSLLNSIAAGKNYYIPLLVIFIVGGLIVSVIAIGVLSLRRKKRQVMALHVATDYKSIQNLEDLRPRELEELAARVYERLGYRNIDHTGAHSSRDGGVDVWMQNTDGRVEIVQCKQLSSRVDRNEMVKFAKTIRQNHAVVGHYWAPNEFTQPAIDFAKEHNIKLYEHREIAILVERAFPAASANIQNTASVSQVASEIPLKKTDKKVI